MMKSSNQQTSWESFSNITKVGTGSFGSVFVGEDFNGKTVALKRINSNISPHRIIDELNFLEIASTSTTLVPSLLDAFRDKVPPPPLSNLRDLHSIFIFSLGTVALRFIFSSYNSLTQDGCMIVMEYFEHDDFRTYKDNLNVLEVKSGVDFWPFNSVFYFIFVLLYFII
jgi:serine/threonine protein kinase